MLAASEATAFAHVLRVASRVRATANTYTQNKDNKQINLKFHGTCNEMYGI